MNQHSSNPRKTQTKSRWINRFIWFVIIVLFVAFAVWTISVMRQ